MRTKDLKPLIDAMTEDKIQAFVATWVEKDGTIQALSTGSVLEIIGLLGASESRLKLRLLRDADEAERNHPSTAREEERP